jgi:hypothetical protein
MGHDSLNQWVCVEVRAKRLGVYGLCRLCGGHGRIYFNDAIRKKADRWYDKERYHPPTGEGYQVWETVSEGSPISPVFKTAEETVDWLIGKGYSSNAARSFVYGSGWSPSGMIGPDGVARKDIESLSLRDEPPPVGELNLNDDIGISAEDFSV